MEYFYYIFEHFVRYVANNPNRVFNKANVRRLILKYIIVLRVFLLDSFMLIRKLFVKLTELSLEVG